MSHYSGSVPDTYTRPSDWLTKAPCKAEPDAMFATSTAGIVAAKDICRSCSVIESCLQWALDTGTDYGVWGGLSEQERRALRRRPVKPISIDDYTGHPKSRATIGLTLQQVWDINTLTEGEHLLWAGPKVINQPGTKNQITPNRLAFYLDRGHWPQGDTKRMCRVRGCVKPAHLTDRTERTEEADLAVAS